MFRDIILSEGGARMAIVYKFDVLDALKKNGYTTYRLRAEKIMSESTMQKLRKNDMVAISNIEIICKLLSCQPGDVLEYVENDSEVIPLF